MKADDIDEYVNSLKEPLETFRRILVADSSKESVFAFAETLLKELVSVAVEERKQRVVKATLGYFVMRAVLDVIEKNPMYGSHALVLQWDSALSSRIQEYRQRLLRLNEELSK